MAEANIFVVDKNEITVHWKVTVPESESPQQDLNDLFKLTSGLLVGLKRDGFKPDPSKAARKQGGNPNWKPQAKVIVDGVEMKCPDCGGGVYDNRSENVERKAKGQNQRPEFACKNKGSCGWIRWPGKGNDEDAELAGLIDPDSLPFE